MLNIKNIRDGKEIGKISMRGKQYNIRYTHVTNPFTPIYRFVIDERNSGYNYPFTEIILNRFKSEQSYNAGFKLWVMPGIKGGEGEYWIEGKCLATKALFADWVSRTFYEFLTTNQK